jgi:uncharacterized membrane protein (UPF0127 family)
VENKIYHLKNQTGEVICHKMIIAKRAYDRMKGLMFSTEMPSCDGFLITPCNSIHTFFMLYDLDLLFFDKNFKVVKVFYGLSPWRITWIYFRAYQVLEMKAGTLTKGIKEGDKFEAICLN